MIWYVYDMKWYDMIWYNIIWYIYRGEAWGSSEHGGPLSLSLIDLSIQVGGMLTLIALRHQKMLLRWRCCYVEGVVTLKMLVCWRCSYKCVQNGFADVKRNKNSCAFRPWFSGGLWHFYVNQKKPEINQKTRIPMVSTKIT